MRKKQVPDQMDILILDVGSKDGSVDPDYLRGSPHLVDKTGPGRVSAPLCMGFTDALTQGCQGVIAIDGNQKDGVDAIREI